MRCWKLLMLIGVFGGGTVAGVATAATSVRYYEENGQTIREITETVSHPVAETKWVTQTQTYNVTQPVTKNVAQNYTQYVPVTQYQWQPKWHGTWRIFREPELAYHLVPTTTYQAQTQTVQTPVTEWQTAPATRTVQVPVTETKYLERPHVTRVAVGPASTNSASTSTNPPSATVPATVPPQAPQSPGYIYQPPATIPIATGYVPAYGSRPILDFFRPPPTYIPVYNYGPVNSGPYGGVARLQNDPPRVGLTDDGWRAR